MLYLVFNEGYAASHGDHLVRGDLCREGIRLARLLSGLMPDEPEVHGLLALLLLTDARRPARVADDGALVRLADQDRTRWDHEQAAEGRRIVAACIRRVKAESGYSLDPHTACGVVAATKTAGRPETPVVVLATAHPAKFPDAIEAITGERPALPPRLAALMSEPERMAVLPNDLGAIKRFVDEQVGRRQGAAA